MTRKELLLSVLLASSALGGCVVSGPSSLETALDPTVTGGIARPSVPAPPSPEQISDERLVRNAVSAARIEDTQASGVPWTNSDTGTSGVITAIEEMQEGGSLCRAFQTSRQRFDGVALYRGKACTRGAGEWTLVSFQENG